MIGHGFDAGHSVAVVRSPGLCLSRRRGPRSESARLARLARRRDVNELCGNPLPQSGGSCEAEPMPLCSLNSFSILHLNVQGLQSHLAELDARVQLLATKPALLSSHCNQVVNVCPSVVQRTQWRNCTGQ